MRKLHCPFCGFDAVFFRNHGREQQQHCTNVECKAYFIVSIQDLVKKEIPITYYKDSSETFVRKLSLKNHEKIGWRKDAKIH